MKIKMKIQITGTRNGVSWPPPGKTIELPDAEGAKLCANGFATPVVEDKVEEAVPKKTAETRSEPAKATAAKKA